MNKNIGMRNVLRLTWLCAAALASTITVADEGDPPGRIARLAFIQGNVSFEPAGTTDWVVPFVNRPLTTGDQLWSDSGGRAELELDGSALRLSSSTAVSFLNLTDSITQVRLSSGTLVVRVRRLNDNETYEIDTPNLAFSILRPGLYRLSVDPSGSSTAIVTRSGQGEVTGAGVAYPVYADEQDVFSGTDQLAEDSQPLPAQDAFDAWSADLDGRWDRSQSARYVAPDVVGYGDLDAHGDWSSTPDYGAVWYPNGLQAGWTPYRYGHWAYVPPWGYTWVDDSPWGFAPFHYGRWAWVQGRWGWIPPPPPGPQYVPAVYAPALVAWAGVGAGVAWFALGPREVYVPPYPVSRGYVDNVNISNTTVNKTVVTNVYNTTIINKTVINNITYVNRNAPGAVVATSEQAFISAQPVAKNTLKVDARTLASAPVRAAAPAIAPTREAVLGTQRTASKSPPAAIEKRTVVARTAPPAPPPSFAQRQAAIKSNGGKPLSAEQVRQLSGSATRAAAVKVAPPAHLVARSAAHPTAVNQTKPASSEAPQRAEAPREQSSHPEAPAAGARGASAQPTKAVHPKEAPAVPTPPSPSTAESALQRQHLQQQQHLVAQQNAERDRLQQQQEAEHRQPVAKAHPQELEAKHQAQTTQLLKQHEQQQQAMQSRQNAEMKRQNEPPPKLRPSPKPAERKPPAGG
jgi:hypothetical protein